MAGWLSVRGLFAMRGLVAFARCAALYRMRCAGRCVASWLRCNALHGARIVCDVMRCDARDAKRGPMRCEVVAMQYAARGLVAFARCRRRHAFDGGIFRVGGEGLRLKPKVL